jgi:transcriptional regulator with GAF, ATPase, and Fis domain
MLAELDREWGDLVYASDEMAEVVEMARLAARSDEKVLLTGDTGVGKGAVAHEIHRNSKRSSEQLVVVECAGIAESLADNELFGHEKGAFTGANMSVDGVCRAAHHGTLFLDEIGDMPMTVQAKIRRMLDDGYVRRVGGTKDIAVSARIISATNRDLEQDAKDGRFRADLLYRLDVIRIHIPPLRERRSDIIPLALHFLGRHRTPEGESYDLAPDAVVYLEGHDWPGNVRQLKHAIDRVCTLTAGPTITGGDLSDGGGRGGGLQSWALIKQAAMEKLERETVLRALAAAGTAKGASDVLEVSPSFIFSVIKRRNILEEEWKKPR